jgi:hypothetical protein
MEHFSGREVEGLNPQGGRQRRRSGFVVYRFGAKCVLPPAVHHGSLTLYRLASFVFVSIN